MIPHWITETRDGLCLHVHVVPRASRTELRGIHGEAVRLRLKAPPVDGKANSELVRFLSETLGVPRGHVSIQSGLSGRDKRVLIQGITVEHATMRLAVTPDARD